MSGDEDGIVAATDKRPTSGVEDAPTAGSARRERRDPSAGGASAAGGRRATLRPVCESAGAKLDAPQENEMQSSYESLIADHAEIEEQARVLVADLARFDRADAAAAAQGVADLAALVERHVEQEDAVMASLTGREAAAAWGADWEEVRASFDVLRGRWISFIERWTTQNIAAAWPEFRLEARSVLLHLRDQVARETELFYSAALRAGAIRLRAG